MSDIIEGERPKRGRPSNAEIAAREEQRRPEVREESPRTLSAREEAERIVREYDEQFGGDGFDQGSDRYYIHPDLIPDYWDYNWKTLAVLNEPATDNIRRIHQARWRAVLTERHPELMPPGTPKETPIVIGGLGLYERPLEFSLRQRAREAKDARDAVLTKEIQAGNAPAGSLDRVKPVIKKGYTPSPLRTVAYPTK